MRRAPSRSAAAQAPDADHQGPDPVVDRHGALAMAPVVLGIVLLGVVEAVLLNPSGSGAVPQGGPGVLSSAAVLLSGVLVAHRWSVSGHRGDAWLVLAVLFLGAEGLATSTLWSLAPQRSTERAGLLAGLDIAMVAGALVVATVARRTRRFAGSPLLGGCLVVCFVVGVRVLATYAGPAIPAGSGTIAALAGLGVQMHLVLAAVVLDAEGPPPWLRLRLAGAVGLHGVLTASSYLEPGGLRYGIGFVAALGVACLCVTTALRLVRVTLTDQHTSRRVLEDQLERAAATVRTDRETLHEIGATLAGIASASELIRSGAPVLGERREALEQMMRAEVARLQRLLHTPEPLGAVDLDEAIRHVVVSHRARGTTVDWRPTGAVVHGRGDAIAEIVNILLDNAAHHGAPDAGVRVEIRAVDTSAATGSTPADDWVEIRVSDRGPGVPPELREQIFGRGVSRAGSPGQGLGLAIAVGLVADLGGSLRLHDTSGGGTTFALRLLRHRATAVTAAATS